MPALLDAQSASATILLSADLSPTPDCASVARDLLGHALEGCISPDLLDTVLLLATELITNAAAASAPTPLELRVSRSPVGTLLVEVADTCSELPRPRTPELLAESGRGLHLLGYLAGAWGAHQLRDGGKVAWFEVQT
jgi:hypothetical protein